MKSFKTFLSLCLLSSAFVFTNQEETIDPWRFLEYKLITTPHHFGDKMHILKLIPSSLGAAVGGAIGIESVKSLNTTPSFIEQYGEINEKNKNYTIGVSGLLGASLAYGIMDVIIQHEVDMQTIRSFVTQWPAYKKYCPQQLHDIFDDLYQMYLFDAHSYKFYHNAIDALSIARNHIYHQFPENYGYRYKRSGITTRSKRLIWHIMNSAPIKMVLSTIKLFV